MKRRTTIAVMMVLAGFSVIIGRLFVLQVLDFPVYETLSKHEREREARIQGARGVILSADGHPLADNRSVMSLAADPNQIRHFESPTLLSAQLAPVLGMSSSTIRKKFFARRRFVWIKHEISAADRKRIGTKIRGLYFLPEKKRSYPYKSVFRPVVGWVHPDGTPISGIEKKYDEYLKGKTGTVVREVSARGRSYFQTESGSPDTLSGNTVQTTLIASLQEYTQDALDEEIRAVDAIGGIVLVMDPRTGAVLSLASRVSGRWGGISPGVSLVYEPGSIFKLVTASAALNEHRVSGRDTFYCFKGAMPIPGGVLHDAEPYDTLTLGEILAHSSNIGIAQVASRLGPEVFARYIRKFGFGQKTNIDFPGESGGIFRGTRHWSRRSLYTIAMGQEVGVTPIQLITAVSAIANGGTLMRPYFVRRVTAPDGRVLYEHRPEKVRRVISKETSRTLLSLLTGVVSPEGTGASAAITGFNVAGKTGTAEVYDPEKHAYSRTRTVDSFVGILPVDNPSLVVLVVVIQPKGISWGGTVAAPLFRKVAEMALVQFRIPASKPRMEGDVVRADFGMIP